MSTYADFPVLMNLMRIIIEQLSVANTVVDNDFREPIGVKSRPVQTELEGQVNMKFTDKPIDRTFTGDREGTARSRGKLVFQKYYLDTFTPSPIVFQKGDKIIEVGPSGAATTLNAIVYDVVPVAPLRGQFVLVEILFEYDHDTRESIGGT